MLTAQVTRQGLGLARKVLCAGFLINGSLVVSDGVAEESWLDKHKRSAAMVYIVIMCYTMISR